MALKLRRGTNAQRAGITFAEGELVYITDSKKLYIGDGASQGGNLVSGMNNLLEDQTPQLGGNLDLNGNNIIGTGNINITGSLTMTTGFLAVDTKGSVFANDSGLLVDGIAGKHVLANNALGDLGNVAGTAPTDGQVLKWNNSASQWQPQADSTGNHPLNSLSDVNAGSPQNLQALVWDSGTSKWVAGDVLQQGEFLDGDFRGSVFGDDSTLIVDGINHTITATNVITKLISGADTLEITNPGGLRIDGTSAEGTSFLGLRRESLNAPVTDTSLRYGTIFFEKLDSNGYLTSTVMNAYETHLEIGHNSTGTIASTDQLRLQNGKLGVGKTPTESLDVNGNAVMSGFIKPGSFTTTQRDALTAANGMIVYNTTTNKFQGRANGAWVDLH